MSRPMILEARSWFRGRYFGMVVSCAIAIGVLGGFWATRSQPRSQVFPAVDPNASCGPVSLAIIGHWLGSPRSIAELNELSHSYESGTSSLLDLKEAAGCMGLAAETVRLDPSRPIPWRLPTVLHLSGNHFVAILPIDGDHMVFTDPPKAPKVLDRRGLAGDWNGITLVVAPSRTDLERELRQAEFRPAPR